VNTPPKTSAASDGGRGGARALAQGSIVRKGDCLNADKPIGLAVDHRLATHILDHHLRDVRDGWEVAFLRSLATVRGDLSAQQADALKSIWKRIQGDRAA
jgi:hypothetical protein